MVAQNRASWQSFLLCVVLVNTSAARAHGTCVCAGVCTPGSVCRQYWAAGWTVSSGTLPFVHTARCLCCWDPNPRRAPGRLVPRQAPGSEKNTAGMTPPPQPSAGPSTISQTVHLPDLYGYLPKCVSGLRLSSRMFLHL